jgi:transposase
MQIKKTDQNDAEGLAQIVRTKWYRSVHVKSFDSHRARALLGAQGLNLSAMTTRLSNHIREVLKTLELLPGAMRGLPDRKVEALLLDRLEVALIVRPMLVAGSSCASRLLFSTKRSVYW